MKILQVNTAVNTGSTGRIAEAIGQQLINGGHRSCVAYGRGAGISTSETIHIGGKLSQAVHGLATRIFDRHGFSSAAATRKFVSEAAAFEPDIIHLHNIHGYYIHAGVLFEYIKQKNIPVVWTLHDCWPFTGHCSHFDFVQCDKWKTHCDKCPLQKRYPQSYVLDNSFNNFDRKRETFNGVQDMTLVTPSNWLCNLLSESYLSNYPVRVINNGIDLQRFKPVEDTAAIRQKLGIAPDDFVILGVASVWDRGKGLADFIKLSAVLNKGFRIVLVGLPPALQKQLPGSVIAVERTENQDELIRLYNMAGVFMNPTWLDNFPTTNIEALACGTPVITYRTGGSIEAVNENTGLIVNKGDVTGLKEAVEKIAANGKGYYSAGCRSRAVQLYSGDERFADYIRLYKEILENPKGTK